MSEKTKKSLKIVSQEEISKDIYSMWLQADEMADAAKPGQFLSLYTRDGSKLLPRPISICEIDREKRRIRLVYRVTGKGTGTEAFSRLHAGVPVEVLGPLGNGFPLEEAKGKRVFLMGCLLYTSCNVVYGRIGLSFEDYKRCLPTVSKKI